MRTISSGTCGSVLNERSSGVRKSLPCASSHLPAIPRKYPCPVHHLNLSLPYILQAGPNHELYISAMRSPCISSWFVPSVPEVIS